MLGIAPLARNNMTLQTVTERYMYKESIILYILLINI